MEYLLETLQYDWAIRALIASIIVGTICGILGCFIVLRHMSMVGDALSHSVLPGVVVAFVLVGYNPFGFFVGAVVAGLLTAIIIIWIQKNVSTKNDAAIGIVFTTMFSIGVIGISKISKNDGVHLDLKDFLFGNILGVGTSDIYLSMGIGLFIVGSVVVFYRSLFATSFQPVVARTMGFKVDTMNYFLMLLLSFAVVASLQTVGVILVVAMLITPASAALLLSNHLKSVIAISAIIGILSAVLGLALAICFNSTPGPVIALVAAAFYIFAVIFSPSKGLLWLRILRMKRRFQIKREDFLKESFKLEKKGNYNEKVLREKLDWPNWIFSYIHRQLVSTGHAKQNLDSFPLTASGTTVAQQMVRAHRLWETYLVNKMGMLEDQIHEDAEKVEHILTDEILSQIDKSLGSPETDPHGSRIPRQNMAGEASLLFKLKVGKRFQVSAQNPIELLASLGLIKEEVYYLVSKTTGHFILRSEENKIIEIDRRSTRYLKVNI